MAISRKTVKRVVKAHGAAAMIAIHKADLEDLGAEIGTELEVTLSRTDAAYERTRAAAEETRARYGKTLALLRK